jgi:hypothetical protein
MTSKIRTWKRDSKQLTENWESSQSWKGSEERKFPDADSSSLFKDFNFWNSGIQQLLFFGKTGIWTQGFVLTNLVLYFLSHTASLFCSGYFGDGVLWTMCLSWPCTKILPTSAFQVARITVVSHQHPDQQVFERCFYTSGFSQCFQSHIRKLALCPLSFLALKAWFYLTLAWSFLL